MTTAYLNDREASYIDLENILSMNTEGWFKAIDMDGNKINIPINSILYVEEDNE